MYSMSSMCLIVPPPVCRVPDLEWPHLVQVLHTDVALAELLKVDRLYRPLVVEIATRWHVYLSNIFYLVKFPATCHRPSSLSRSWGPSPSNRASCYWFPRVWTRACGGPTRFCRNHLDPGCRLPGGRGGRCRPGYETRQCIVCIHWST